MTGTKTMNSRIFPFATVFALALAGCATTAEQERSIAELAASVDQIPTERMSRTRTSPPVQAGDSVEPRAKPALFPGNDQLIKAPVVRERVEVVGEAVALRFEQAPVGDVVHAIL